MKRRAKLLACIVASSMTLMQLPVSADTAGDYIFAQTFNDVVTNKQPEQPEIKGSLSRVIEISSANKALQLLGSANETTATVKYGASGDRYIASLDISADGPVSGKIGFKADNTDVTLLQIQNNTIMTIDGKVAGGFTPRKFTTLAVQINRRTGKYSLYLDGSCVLYKWRLPSNPALNTFYFLRSSSMEDSVYLDNLLIYEGEQVRAVPPGGPFNKDAVEFLPIVDDLGDFTFFNSNWITHRYTAYPNTTLNPKTNEIITEKFDHYNMEKGDRIILKKHTNDDVFFDVTTRIFSNYVSDKSYKHFVIGADLMADIRGSANAHAFVLRDNQTTGAQQNITTAVINNNGSLTLMGGKTIHGVAAKGQWFNIRVYVNLETFRLTIFVNGKLEGENIAIPRTFQALNMARLIYRTGAGSGEIQVRNMEVTGLDKPFQGEEIRTSMFPGDDTVLKDYLADKTAFHFYGKSIYKNSAKEPMTGTPVYEGGELYITEADFNKAFDTDARFEKDAAVLEEKRIALTAGTRETPGGGLLIPVREASEKLLGRFTVDDKMGMVLTGREAIHFDVDAEVPYHLRRITSGVIDRFSALQHLNDFLLFDRPDRERLLEGFNQATADGSLHPRILATREDFEAILEASRTDGDLGDIVKNLISQADKAILAEPIVYRFQDNLRLTTQGDNLRNRMTYFGFAYQMTGEQKYIDAAWANLSVLSDFPDINPGHPIDVGSFTHGMAIGYDWMYHGFTPEQRKVIEDNAFRLGITVMNNGFYGRTPARGGPDGNINIVGYYNKWISNYNTWVNHGTMMAALAFMERDPELCTDMLWHSLRSSEYTLKNFYPDGAWVESTNYWGIAAGYLAYEIMMLEKIYGTSFNLAKFPGVSETGLFMASMRGPLGSYNYHDAGESSMLAEYPFMFYGTYFDQPELLAARKIAITGAIKGIVKATPHLFDALLYNPDVDISDVKRLPRVRVTRGLEAFSVRGEYMDYNTLFFASHAGPVSWYHAHNDNGDFIFDMLGQRWAMALGPEDYNSSLSASERYRYRPEGHNTVTINNGSTLNQLANTYAPMIRSQEGEGGALCVYDMTPMYVDASHYHRGFLIGDNFRSLTVRDEIKLTKPSEIYWFMHTTAQAVITGDNTVLLSKGGQSITLVFDSDAKSQEVSVMDARPLPTSPEGKGQNGNVGVRKVAIRLTADQAVNLTVRLSEFHGEVDDVPIDKWTAPAAIVSEDEGDFGFTLRMEGKEIDSTFIPIEEEDSIPALEFLSNDPAKRIETDIPQKSKEPVVVRVYSQNGKRFKSYSVPFTVIRRFRSDLYNILEIKEFEVSAEPEPENIGKNMFDDSFDTRWTTLSLGETAVFDLGSPQTVEALAAGFWRGNERKYKFELYASADGAQYTLLGEYESAGTTEDYEVFQFGPVNARYVKLVGRGNTANVNTNILELRLLSMKGGAGE